MIQLTNEQRQAVEVLRQAKLNTDDGMPQELFLLLSGLIPLANVDLLVTNSNGQLLLERRCDSWYQNSWHIPCGCMHYGETFSHCIHATAQRELGTDVIAKREPVAVRSIFRGVDPSKVFPRERGHNVAVLFQCQTPKNWRIDNHGKTAQDDGFLAWFDTLPPDFMRIQCAYEEVLAPWKQREDDVNACR